MATSHRWWMELPGGMHPMDLESVSSNRLRVNVESNTHFTSQDMTTSPRGIETRLLQLILIILLVVAVCSRVTAAQSALNILSFNGDTGFVHDSKPLAKQMIVDFGSDNGWTVTNASDPAFFAETELSDLLSSATIAAQKHPFSIPISRSHFNNISVPEAVLSGFTVRERSGTKRVTSRSGMKS